MAKLTEFISNLNSLGGVSRSSLFVVEITTPPALSKISEARQLSLLCNGTNLPGINVGTDDRNIPQGYGYVQKMPWGVNFTDTNLSFYADNKGIISKLLINWVNSIVDFNRSTLDENNSFLINYRANYATNIVIKHLNQLENSIVEYTLHDAFPTTIYDQQMDWNNRDTSNLIIVKMMFTRWTSKHFDLAKNEAVTLRNLNSVVGNTIKYPSQTIGLGKSTEMQDFANRVVSQAAGRYIENVQQAIPLLSGVGLGNIRF